jgi:hypothetical protein
MDALSERDLKLLQFTLLSLAVQGYTLSSFWSALGGDEKRVFQLQGHMREEFTRLVNELWPPPADAAEDWPP